MITYQTEYAQSLIDDFSIKEKAPHISISVDMLDTGIDVPEVVNLLFFKPVRSKTKFWQMMGRGTRLCPDLYGPGADKQDFLVLDFCENLEFFNADPATAEGPLAMSLGERLFKARLQLISVLDTQSPDGIPQTVNGTITTNGLRWDTAFLLHDTVVSMNLDNFVVRPHRRWVETYAEPDAWKHLSPEAVREIDEHLAGLPSALVDSDEQAKRFDLLLLRLQLGQLNDEPAVERLRRQVQDIATALLQQTAISAIQAQAVLWEEIAGATGGLTCHCRCSNSFAAGSEGSSR